MNIIKQIKNVLPTVASILTGVLLLLGLSLSGLGFGSLNPGGGVASALAETTSPAPVQQVLPAPLFDQSLEHRRIAVKLAAGAQLLEGGIAQPGSQTVSREVSELVTTRGHRLDLSGYRVHKEASIPGLDVQVLDLPDQANLNAALAELRLDPGVVWAEMTQPVYASVVPNDPYYAQEWAPTKVGLPTAWDVTTGSANVTIAVVDTGLDSALADFSGRIVSPYSVADASAAWPYWDDTAGHGTAVAGVAASQGNNASGIAGTAWNVKIMPVKISASGASDDVTLARGVVYAVDNGADVINISFGGPQGSTTMASAISYALSHGVVVVAAAGNSGPGSGISYPAAYSGVISVGATDSGDNVASFSSTGPGLVLSAPGVSILTWNPNAGGSMLSYWDGTSFSSPLVAGIAALMLSVNPGLTPAQVTGILQQTALDLGTPGMDQTYGYGRVRADAALAAAAGQSTTTTTTGATTTTTTAPSTTTTTLPSGTTVRYEETNPLLTYTGTWFSLTGASFSGSSMTYSLQSGSAVTASFTGTGLTWITKTAPNYGKARVTLDGGTSVLVDLYSPSVLTQQPVWSTGALANGSHTLKIEWTGLKNPLSTYTYVGVDAFDVLSGSSSTPTTLPSVTTTTAAPSTTTTTTSGSTTTTTTGATTTTTTAPSTTTTTLPSGTTVRYEETNPLLTYTGTWFSLTGASFSGSSMTYSLQSGSAVTASFTGTGLTWITKTAPNYGKARVTLDGGTSVLVDLYSPSVLTQQPVWSTGALANGSHTLKIEWTGLKNPLSTYTYVGVDAFDVLSGSSSTPTTLPSVTTTTAAPSTTTTTTSGSTTTTTTGATTTTTTAPSTTTTTLPSGTTVRYEETNPLLTYTGTWFSLTGASFSGSSMTYSLQSGSAVTASFTGTGLTWITKTAPNYGKARVTLDGGTSVLVDLYSPSVLTQQPVWSTGALANGSHTLKIEWTGLKNPLSTYTYVGVDAFDVRGTLRSVGILGIGGVIL